MRKATDVNRRERGVRETTRVSALAVAVWFAFAGLALPSSAQSEDGRRTVVLKVVRMISEVQYPVSARVRIHNSDAPARETDNLGLVHMAVEACDDSVTFVVEPASSAYNKSWVRCPSNQDLLLVVVRARSGSVHSAQIEELFENERVLAALPYDLAMQLADVRIVYDMGDYAASALGASDLSIRLLDVEPTAAHALSLLAMDSGFRALGVDPDNPAAPLLAPENPTGVPKLTAFGAEVYDSYASQAGRGGTYRWGYDGLSYLNEKLGGQVLLSEDLIRLDPAMLDLLRLDANGRFTLDATFNVPLTEIRPAAFPP